MACVAAILNLVMLGLAPPANNKLALDLMEIATVMVNATLAACPVFAILSGWAMIAVSLLAPVHRLAVVCCAACAMARPSSASAAATTLACHASFLV